MSQSDDVVKTRCEGRKYANPREPDNTAPERRKVRNSDFGLGKQEK